MVAPYDRQRDAIGPAREIHHFGRVSVGEHDYTEMSVRQDEQVGLVVDSLIGEQEVVIKTLGKFIGDIRGISGATILGDGRMALIADVEGIIAMAIEEKGVAYAA